MTFRSSHTVAKAVSRGGLSPYVATALTVGITYYVAYSNGMTHGALITSAKYRRFLQHVDERQRIASMN